MLSKLMLPILLGLLLWSHPVRAAPNWSWELRGGGDLVTGEPAALDVDPGFGVEGRLAYRLLPHLAGYAGWGWHRFGADHPVLAGDVSLEQTGYIFGLQFAHDFGDSPLGYYLRGGGSWSHLELEAGDKVVDDSGHGLGWQVEAGLVCPLSGGWQLLPGIAYHALEREVEIDAVATNLDLSYLEIGVGIASSF